MAEYEYIGDGRPDGTIVGRTTTEKVGFYGTTPVVQQANIATGTDTATTQAAVNSVIAALETFGFLATS